LVALVIVSPSKVTELILLLPPELYCVITKTTVPDWFQLPAKVILLAPVVVASLWMKVSVATCADGDGVGVGVPVCVGVGLGLAGGVALAVGVGVGVEVFVGVGVGLVGGTGLVSGLCTFKGWFNTGTQVAGSLSFCPYGFNKSAIDC
jgi:hypothetical protein